jgi:hypothetical protein
MAKKTKKKRSGKKTAKSAGSQASSGRGLNSVPLDDLAREMARRQREVNKLVAKRDRLVAQIDDLNQQIADLGGANSVGTYGTTVTGAPRRRPRNEQSLSEALLGVLKNATMSVTEAAEAVQAAGYQTTSSSFRTIVNQTLIKDPRFKKVARGQYTAK